MKKKRKIRRIELCGKIKKQSYVETIIKKTKLCGENN